MLNPERAILADREALHRAEQNAQTAHHPLAKAAYQADIRYLRQLINTHEHIFFLAHGI